jgi:hypothetical protein
LHENEQFVFLYLISLLYLQPRHSDGLLRNEKIPEQGSTPLWRKLCLSCYFSRGRVILIMWAHSGRSSVTESTIFFRCLILPRLNRLTSFLNKDRKARSSCPRPLKSSSCLVKSDRIVPPLFEPRIVRKYLLLRLSASAVIRFGQRSRPPHTYQWFISHSIIPRTRRRSIFPCGNSGEFAVCISPPAETSCPQIQPRKGV